MWVLVRHGLAWDRKAPDCPPDPLRPLTEVGAVKTQAAMRGLVRQLPDDDVVLASSPYLRAMQSAELARQAFAAHWNTHERRFPIHTVEALSPGSDARALHTEHRWPAAKARILFGHSPDLELFATNLLCGRDDEDNQEKTLVAIVKLKKAGAICLQLEGAQGPYKILWALSPRQLRGLGQVPRPSVR